LILTLLFWFDATFTLYRRWRNGEQLSVAHKKHAYQRLVQGGFSHLRVNVWTAVINIFLIGVAYLNQILLHQGIMLLIFVVIIMFYINTKVDKVFKFKI
jgi:Fuc2NAc and GlcNAc transferase